VRRALIITATALTVAATLVAIPQSQAVAGPPVRATTTTTQPDWPAIIRRQKLERLFWAEVVRRQRADAAYLRLLRYAAAVAAARTYPHGLCGGDLPPCYVMRRESGGNITAQNPRSTASGKWQVLDSTWRGWGGVRKARYASEQVQDDFARRLWNHGAGCSHWSACG